MTTWGDVAAAVAATGGHTGMVIERAKINLLSPEVVLESIFRSLRDHPNVANFEVWDAVTVGSIDTRVFGQSTWWVDVLRQPHRVNDPVSFSDEHLRNVIVFLRADPEHYLDGYRKGHPIIEPPSAEDWLESTVLMRALIVEAARRELELPT